MKPRGKSCPKKLENMPEGAFFSLFSGIGVLKASTRQPWKSATITAASRLAVA
jgi:hypothetical protein